MHPMYMERMNPVTEGTWTKIARKTYEHIDGAIVKYDCNKWMWLVTDNNGNVRGFDRLWAAQAHAELYAYPMAVSA